MTEIVAMQMAPQVRTAHVSEFHANANHDDYQLRPIGDEIGLPGTGGRGISQFTWPQNAGIMIGRINARPLHVHWLVISRIPAVRWATLLETPIPPTTAEPFQETCNAGALPLPRCGFTTISTS